MYDLAVYNVTTLTGLLGPAKSVVALTGTVVEQRHVDGIDVRAEADDNLALLMDHGSGVFSCVQSGFVYGPHPEERTVELVGTRGSISMMGWDWLPNGVELWRSDGSKEVVCPGAQGYTWEQGVSYLAGCWADGREPACTIEHAYHVLEVMLGAHASAASGRRHQIESRFAWPVLGAHAGLAAQGAVPEPLDPELHSR